MNTKSLGLLVVGLLFTPMAGWATVIYDWTDPERGSFSYTHPTFITIDVIQCDVLFVGGIGGCRRISAMADLLGRTWSPHTWSNGYGLAANLHAACALSTHGYVEVPYDPPAWSAERRDWMLPFVLEIAGDGTIAPPPGPGLGIEPDLDALERWRVA